MTWPFVKDSMVTDRYDTKRGTRLHRAWDVAAPLGSPIRAPESGRLLLLYCTRMGDPLPDSTEGVLKGQAAKFPWYWADRYGACVILLGVEYWWLFAHVPVSELFRQAFNQHCDMEHGIWRDATNAARRVEVYSNAHDEPIPAADEGDQIGLVGVSGYSTGPHCHMEVIPRGYIGGAAKRIDPATIWGDR